MKLMCVEEEKRKDGQVTQIESLKVFNEDQ